MKKKIKIFAVLLVVIIAISIVFAVIINKNDEELKTVKSKKELLKLYEGETNSDIKEILIKVVTAPFSFFYYDIGYATIGDSALNGAKGDIIDALEPTTASSETSGTKSNTKDFSTTNIQVENVDEADIIKTDGDYIYSISESNVIIADVRNPKEPKIVSKLSLEDDSIPEDLILYKNKLVVISAEENTDRKLSYSYYYSNNMDTVVKVYDITSKENPVLTKSYTMYEPYYTSRCINNVLYVISSGNLRKENDDIVIAYSEDNSEKELEFENIKYLKDLKTRAQTLISVVDLDNERADVDISSYLMDISNAYVSENAIYLLDEKYSYTHDTPAIGSLFGLKGIFGIFDYRNNSESGYKTEIYKFDILKDGNVKYNTKTKIEGKTINQYSLDEKDNHLRVALYDNNGSRIAIFDEKLKTIGVSDYVAKGEKMYSSRFMDNKVYFVTYKTIDPLFVMDLSDETNPKVLGKLKIPGYSTYLHPYDENHIIGIGMETKETVNRNSYGKVISTTARVVGMKMALFDVSNVNAPTQISSVVIGDSRTTSAILTNPKALLFSKEKSLIAIPVNNYSSNFEVVSSSQYSDLVDSYVKKSTGYISEGYFVYNINLQDGFKLKGTITHEKDTTSRYYNYYNRSTKLLRGLYIDNNLYTVSETAIKVNDLDTMEQVGETKIKDNNVKTYTKSTQSQNTDNNIVTTENEI